MKKNVQWLKGKPRVGGALGFKWRKFFKDEEVNKLGKCYWSVKIDDTKK